MHAFGVIAIILAVGAGGGIFYFCSWLYLTKALGSSRTDDNVNEKSAKEKLIDDEGESESLMKLAPPNVTLTSSTLNDDVDDNDSRGTPVVTAKSNHSRDDDEDEYWDQKLDEAKNDNLRLLQDNDDGILPNKMDGNYKEAVAEPIIQVTEVKVGATTTSAPVEDIRIPVEEPICEKRQVYLCGRDNGKKNDSEDIVMEETTLLSKATKPSTNNGKNIEKGSGNNEEQKERKSRDSTPIIIEEEEEEIIVNKTTSFEKQTEMKIPVDEPICTQKNVYLCGNDETHKEITEEVVTSSTTTIIQKQEDEVKIPIEKSNFDTELSSRSDTADSIKEKEKTLMEQVLHSIDIAKKKDDEICTKTLVFTEPEKKNIITHYENVLKLIIEARKEEFNDKRILDEIEKEAQSRLKQINKQVPNCQIPDEESTEINSIDAAILSNTPPPSISGSEKDEDKIESNSSTPKSSSPRSSRSESPVVEIPDQL